MQIQYSTKQKLTNTLQKAHFGDYGIAIRQLIEVIEEQQKQIEELKEIINGNSKSSL